MARKFHSLQKPNLQAVFFISILIFLYARLISPGELASDIEIRGNFAYITAGNAGLRVVDISNPQSPREAGSFNSLGTAKGVAISGNRAYVADGNRGLLVLDVANPAEIKALKILAIPGSADDVAVSGDTVYIASSRAGLLVYNLANLANPVKLNEYRGQNDRGRITRVILQEKHAFIADTASRLRILDIDKPLEIKQVGLFEAGAPVKNGVIIGHYAYLAVSQRGLVVVDIGNLEEPTEVSAIDIPGLANGIAVAGTYAYIAAGDQGMRIIDISDPLSPAEVGKWEGAENAIDLAISDRYVYVADGYEGVRVVETVVQVLPAPLNPEDQHGNVKDLAIEGGYAYLASETSGLQVLDLSTPTSPRQVAIYDTKGEAVGIAAAGDYIYIADRSDGLRILFLANADPAQLQLEEKSAYDSPGRANNVAVAGGHAYLADGDKLIIINIDNPASPVEVGSEETPGEAIGVAVFGHYAYVADSEAGLSVIDISDPTKPARVGAYDTPGIALAVAVAEINTGSRRLFAFVADGDRGLRIIEVTDPRNPREIGHFEEMDAAQDVVVVGTMVYLAGRNDGLVVVDASDPARPRKLSVADTPGNAQSVVISDQYAYVADYERGMRVIDISRPEAPFEAGFYDAPKVVSGVAISGNHAYLADGERGIRVLDAANPQQPVEIGFNDNLGRAKRITLREQQAYVTSEDGFHVVDISDPKKPAKIKSFPTGGIATDIALDGGLAYVASADRGLRIVDISNIEAMQLIGTFDTPGGYASQVVVAGHYVYIADGEHGLLIVNVATPQAPRIASVAPECKDAKGVALAGDYAFVAAGETGLCVVEVAKPAAPEVIAIFDLPGSAADIVAAYPYLFIAGGSAGIQVVYIYNPGKPILVGSYEPAGGSVSLAVAAETSKDGKPGHYYIYSAGENRGLLILDAKKSVAPVEKGIYQTPGVYSLRKSLSAFPQVIAWLATGQFDLAQGKAGQSAAVLFSDVVLFTISAILWLVVIAQYLLPVETNKERLESFQRLIAYLRGYIGPAAVIREGEHQFSDRDTEKGGLPGPGVVLVDRCSAAILERRNRPYPLLLSLTFKLLGKIKSKIRKAKPGKAEPSMRVVGPGMVWTKYSPFPRRNRYDEAILAAADLRPQVRARANVRAFTRDGIEVSTHIITVFTLGQPAEVVKVAFDQSACDEDKNVDKQTNETWKYLRVIELEEVKQSPPVQGKLKRKFKVSSFREQLDSEEQKEIHNYLNPPASKPIVLTNLAQSHAVMPPDKLFQFDAKRIFAAIYGQARDIHQEKQMDWFELPPHVATEVFRNLIARETYDDLYQPGEPDPKKYPLLVLKNKFADEVRAAGVLSYRFVARKDNQPLFVGQILEEDQLVYSPVQELRRSRVLRDRGIKVIFAGFAELQPVSPAIRQRLLDNWRAGWEKEVEITRAEHDLQAMRIRNRARVQAQREMAHTLNQIFKTEPHSQEALAVRVFQALESAATDPVTRQLLPADTISMLRSLRQWLLPGIDESIMDRNKPPAAEPPPANDLLTG